MQDLINKMKKYAKDENVPIIEDDGLEEVIKIIQKYNVKSIIEIGSAIGYSAIMMSNSCDCKIDTIERDPKMHSQAMLNVESANLDSKINLHFGDALSDDFDLPMNVDMLYIDAAKSQYRRFFEKYNKHLKKGSIVVFDNLKFHGYVDMELNEIKSRNLRQLIRKLKEFNQYVDKIEGYKYHFIDVGDGIGVLEKEEDA